MFSEDYDESVILTLSRTLVVHEGWGLELDEEDEFPDWRELESEEQLLHEIRDVAQAICMDNEIPTNLPFSRVVGMEVGDDRVDKSNSPMTLALAQACQSIIYCMKTSDKDTFISSKRFNLCEVTSFVPRAKEENFNYCRKTGDFANLGFVDCVPERVILDVSKGDGSHSSTVVGKAAMVGSRLFNARGHLMEEMHLASYLQDGYLNTGRSPDPKYLPLHMGGSNAPGLFEDHANIYLYVHAYKGGGYDRLYGSATEELMSCIRSMDTGTAKCPVLCTRLREKQEYLYGTYKEHVMVPPKELKSELKGDLPEPVYRAHGGINEFAACELRLIRAKVLITRSQADIEVQKTSRLEDILFGIDTVVSYAAAKKRESAELGKAYGLAIRANTALQNLINREAKGNEVRELRKLGFHDIPEGDRLFRKSHARWIHEGGKGVVYTLRDLSWSEDMYLRDEVSTEECMKVSGIPLDQTLFHKRKIRSTTAKVGLYQINEDQHEWALQLGEQLREMRDVCKGSIPQQTVSAIYNDNREWVNDDSLLIGRVMELTKEKNFSEVVLLVSEDKRLANQMCQSANVTVVLLHPREIFTTFVMRSSEDFKRLRVSEVWSKLPVGVTHLRQGMSPGYLLLDTGSIMANLVNMNLTSRATVYQLRTLKKVRTDQLGRTVLYEINNISSGMITKWKIYRPEILNRNKVYKYPKYKRTLPMKPSHGGNSSEADWRSETSRSTSSKSGSSHGHWT